MLVRVVLKASIGYHPIFVELIIGIGIFVKASNVTAYCRINPRGYKKWSQKLSNKRPKVWRNYKEKSLKWSIEETERLFEAISVLPEVLINRTKIIIFKMKNSKDSGNPATSNFLMM